MHIVFAGEKVRSENSSAAPDVSESEETETFRLVTLDGSVRMKLTAFLDKDRTHLRDLLEVGLIDASWCDRLPPPLATRLKELVENPEG